MDRDIMLLDSYRETASKFRAETERLSDSPAKYLDPDRSIEPSTGIRLYDRARDMRRSFVKDFPGLADKVPILSFEPQGDALPDGSLDRETLRALVSELDTFVQLLAGGSSDTA
jgi:hypothetical protein